MRRWNPERILMLVLVVMLAITWGLVAVGWFSGNNAYYIYAFRFMLLTTGVASSPIILVLTFAGIDWLRGK